MKIHDVSLVLRPDMVTWPGEPGPTVAPLRRIAKGDAANVSLVTFGDHTGTHVDPPVHFIDGANTVDKLPVDALVGPCRVVGFDGPGPGGGVSRGDRETGCAPSAAACGGAAGFRPVSGRASAPSLLRLK